MYPANVVEYSLIQMRDAPAERNVEVEELRKGSGSFAGVGVAPCTERNENLAVLIERHVAVHHGADSH